MKRCIILGSAPVEDGGIFDRFHAKDAFLICADGGMDTARKYGIQPDLLIGDFDSMQGSLPDGIETIWLKPEGRQTCAGPGRFLRLSGYICWAHWAKQFDHSMLTSVCCNFWRMRAAGLCLPRKGPIFSCCARGKPSRFFNCAVRHFPLFRSAVRNARLATMGCSIR
ncbi:MAG: hypothetical protein ACLS8R_09630 [Anaeromassilibacillus sp.]